MRNSLKITAYISFIILTWPFGAHASECPKFTGVYNQQSGLVRAVMAFNITKDGRLFLVSRDTGADGAILEIDGHTHSQILPGGTVLNYAADCDRGYLIVQGTLDGDEFVMMFSDESGGKIVTSDSRGKVVYERSLRGFLR